MEFKSISLASQVFEKLEENIITGVYPRGEILTEMKLVEQLGVSRTPIREALRRLEQEHLIRECGRGAVVLGITAQDVIDIMEVRQQLEGTATYYATKNATAEDLDKLRHITELQEFYYTRQNAEKLREMEDHLYARRAAYHSGHSYQYASQISALSPHFHFQWRPAEQGCGRTSENL